LYIAIAMSDLEDKRPDPDVLLNALKKEEEQGRKAKLKIFFGMCAGVGKTYDMLKAAHEARSHGIDVVIGFVETHGRPETEALVQGLTVIPRKRVEYKGTVIEEMDLDAILMRKPALVLVDELAHTNVPGSRHTKRYKDVTELLDSGIDVYTTLNVQHLESRADTVAQITGSLVRETVPDSMLELADEVELIDIPPDELLNRLSEGKVYTPERSKRAVENFFRKGNLTALREMSLRITAERVDQQLRDYMRTKRISGPWKSGQRLIVGISGSPHTINLIRWARRMAFTLDASWVAVHVESSRPMSESEKERLGKNFKLARELGAEVVTTADENIAEAIIRIARQENCSQILVGKSRHSGLRRSHDLLRQLLAKSGDLDVYVVGGQTDEQERKGGFRLPEITSGMLQYAAAAAIILGVVLCCYPLSRFVGYQAVALVLLLTVALLPLRLGIGPVLLAAALSALAWDFFYIPPLFTFSIGRPEDVLMLATYFCIAFVTGVLTTRARAQEKAVRMREERAVALYTLTRDLTAARSKDEVARSAVANVRRFFDADVVICLGQADGDIFTAAHPESAYQIDEKEFAVAAWVYWNEKKAGRFTDTLPSSSATYFPLSGPRYPLGVIGVRLHKESPLSMDQETLLENFLRQISMAIERETLNEMTKQSIVIEESERLYKTLFNSISHEMRTPLSAILSASESLQDGSLSPAGEVQLELRAQIHEAAGRLNRLVENLLDMTRLESGLIQPKLDWCDMNDLINTTTRKLGKELEHHRMEVDVSPEVDLLKMDFALMEQVLTNLLLNASHYTPAGSEIKIGCTRDGNQCVITVADNGPGLPPGSEEKIFEKFYRLPGAQAGGTGLGLSIAKGFVEAHKGTIKAERREGGGTRFTIRIPLQSLPAQGTEG
jgi:two-component system sensor histidine kinase KdpD